MIVSREMQRRGWYAWPDGVGYRDLVTVCGWRLRAFDFGVGLEPVERRGLELWHPRGWAFRLGLFLEPKVPSLFRVRLRWPQQGSGYWVLMVSFDVVAFNVRGWHDGGEASYLS
jgi:hypothetical protein